MKKLIIFFSLLFLYCEKEQPLQVVDPMDSFNPEFVFEELPIPSGLKSSSDSIAQVVHHYLQLANTMNDYRQWYSRPEDYSVWDIKRTNKPGFQQWDLSWEQSFPDLPKYNYGLWKIDLIINRDNLQTNWMVKVTYEMNTIRSEPGKSIFMEYPYINISVSRDQMSGMFYKAILNHKYNFDVETIWEWEVDLEQMEFRMTIICNYLRNFTVERPGKIDMVIDEFGSGNLIFNRFVKVNQYEKELSASWTSNGAGRYFYYDDPYKNGVWY